MIEAVAWKNLINDKCVYMIQICSGSAKDINYACNVLKDWKQTGSGFNKSGDEVLLFSKPFEDSVSWIQWAKNLPFPINEMDREGNPKRVKTLVDTLEPEIKYRCKLCNKGGHNKQTCPMNPKNKVEEKKPFLTAKEANASASIKIKAGRSRLNKCGKCGMLGHNSRRCVTEINKK